MKRKIVLTFSLLTILSLTACNNSPKYTEEDIINAFTQEALTRIDNHGKVGNKKDDIPISALKDYPTSFDLRKVDTNNDGIDENYVTGVKFQRPFGTCWSFGSTAAAETSILYDLGQEAIIDDKDTIDLSEHHTAWYAYTPLPQTDVQGGEGLISMVDGVNENPSLRLNSGSTQFAASSLWASGMGVVQEPEFDETSKEIEAQLTYRGKNAIKTTTEKGYAVYSKEDDWSVDESLRFRQSYMLENSFYLPQSVYIKEDGTMDIDYCDLASKAYKEQLMKGRALVLGFKADAYLADKVEGIPKYINGETWAHYTYEPSTPNHSVCVVGWDDNYSRTNFLTKVQCTVNGEPAYDKEGKPIMKAVNQPPKDGAWIVKNSWGALDTNSQGLTTSDWGIDGTGYFYLSYYDLSIDSVEAYDFDVTNSIKGELDEYIIEQHDLMPNEAPHNIETNFPIAEGNVFIAEESETIKFISCISTEYKEEMNISFYKFKGDDLDYNHPVLEFSKQFDNKGIHVIELPNSISLNKGEKIAVAISQKTDNNYFLSVGSEWNKKGYDNNLCDDKYYAVGVVNKGESFVILENQVFDFADLKQKMEEMDGPTSFLSYDNFPIKLYASIDKI
ncbi:MAG: lectin like domain-containing protein [Bacilli bacterium]|nr:lectin like domain-containing protein [Bacilli bacterium]